MLSKGGRSERVDSDADSSARAFCTGRAGGSLTLDRAELADHMIGKTQVILDGAGG